MTRHTDDLSLARATARDELIELHGAIVMVVHEWIRRRKGLEREFPERSGDSWGAQSDLWDESLEVLEYLGIPSPGLSIEDSTTYYELWNDINALREAIAEGHADAIADKFESIGRGCERLDIDVDLSTETVLANASILRLTQPTLLYAPTDVDLAAPRLIVPAQEYFRSLLARHPRMLFELTPRSFEELIAELFREQGFDVELTQQTRDGGRDIIAVSQIMGLRSKYLSECKRWAPTNRVGIAIVQRLYGVKMAELATKALLVTTSSYSRDALAFANRHIWELDLRAYEDLVLWLRSGYKW